MKRKIISTLFALVLACSLSLVMTVPVAAVVTGVTINSPLEGDPAFVQSGGSITVDFSVTAGAVGEADITVQVKKGANIIGSSSFGYDFQGAPPITANFFPVIVISATTSEGLYDVLVESRQPKVTGDWVGDTATDAVIVDNTVPPVPTLASPADGTFTNDATPALDWSDVSDPSGVKYDVQVDNNVTFLSPEHTSFGLVASTDTTVALVDGTYYWRARAVDGVPNDGDWSTVWTFTVDATAPAQATLVSPEDAVTLVDNYTPTLDWEDVTDPSGVTYDVEVDGTDDTFGNIVYTKTGLDASTDATSTLGTGTYYWHARAVDKAGTGNEGAFSAAWSFTISDTIVPAAPILLLLADGTFTNDATPDLDWEDVDDPSGVTYEVQVDDDADFGSITWTGSPGTSTATTAALAEDTYYWRARAVDGVPNDGAWSAVWTFTVDTTAPEAPNLVSPDTGATLGTSNPTLNWSVVTDPAGVTYTVQVDTDDAFTAPILIDVSAVATSQFIPTLADGVYYWRIATVDGAGNASGWSTVRYFRVEADTEGPAVTVTSPNGGESYTEGSIQSITWSATDTVGVTAIDLYYSSDGGDSWTSVASSEANDGAYSWTVPDVDSSQSQCLVKVEATDAVGNVGTDLSDAVFTISPVAVEPEPVTSIELKTGWNFISVPKKLAAGSDTFGDLLPTGTWLLRYSYEADPDAADYGWSDLLDATQVQVLEGYWIKTESAGTITLSYAATGQQVPPSKSLVGDAWNAIGFSNTSAETAENTLKSVEGSWSTVIGWDADGQAYEDAIIAPGTENMLPGKGYWIWVTQDDVLSAISG